MIHYNSSAPEPDMPSDSQRGIWCLSDLRWDSANNAYRCGAALTLHLLITGNTVLTGADSVEDMIHTTLQNSQHVTTQSEGQGSARHVVISPIKQNNVLNSPNAPRKTLNFVYRSEKKRRR